MSQLGRGRHSANTAVGGRPASPARTTSVHGAAFVAEEQEHARLLSLVLDHFVIVHRTTHWSDRAVRADPASALTTHGSARAHGRRGHRPHLLRLPPRNGAGDEAVCDVFRRIQGDEVVHVDFHCDTLPSHLARFSSAMHWLARGGLERSGRWSERRGCGRPPAGPPSSRHRPCRVPPSGERRPQGRRPTHVRLTHALAGEPSAPGPSTFRCR